MDRHKIHQHGNACGVQGIHQRGKACKPANALGGGKIPAPLVAPAAVKRVFCQRQKLHMGVVVLHKIGHQTFCQLRPAVIAAVPMAVPAGGVQFVNQNGSIPAGTAQQGSGERVIRLRQAGSRAGQSFKRKGKRVCPQLPAAVRPLNVILVQLPKLRLGHPPAPQAVLTKGELGGGIEIPAVPVPQQLHAAGVRRPQGKQPAAPRPRRVGTQQAVSVKADAAEKLFHIRPHSSAPLPCKIERVLNKLIIT